MQSSVQTAKHIDSQAQSTEIVQIIQVKTAHQVI